MEQDGTGWDRTGQCGDRTGHYALAGAFLAALCPALEPLGLSQPRAGIRCACLGLNTEEFLSQELSAASPRCPPGFPPQVFPGPLSRLAVAVPVAAAPGMWLVLAIRLHCCSRILSFPRSFAVPGKGVWEPRNSSRPGQREFIAEGHEGMGSCYLCPWLSLWSYWHGEDAGLAWYVWE